MIDNFRIGRELGKGCSATVYHAVRLSDNQDFALKVFNLRKARENNVYDGVMRALRDEVEVISQLNHENIIKYECSSEEAMWEQSNGTVQRVAYIAMEYAERGDLLEFLIADTEPLQEGIAKRVTLQLLNALTYLSSQGLAHRDLKLENILIDKGYNVKVADFGLSGKIENENKSGMYCEREGTPAYMAPEILLRRNHHS